MITKEDKVVVTTTMDYEGYPVTLMLTDEMDNITLELEDDPKAYDKMAEHLQCSPELVHLLEEICMMVNDNLHMLNKDIKDLADRIL